MKITILDLSFIKKELGKTVFRKIIGDEMNSSPFDTTKSVLSSDRRTSRGDLSQKDKL